MRYRIATAYLVITFTASLFTAYAAEEVVGARYPALAPDGQSIAFEYWGDIWLAPVDGRSPAQRLTDHRTWDYFPRFSPDGKWLAFVSRRGGSDDLWIMPAEGGTARQLTYYSGTDMLCSWTADSKQLVFTSRRSLWSDDLYLLGLDGDTPPQQITGQDHYSVLDGWRLPNGGWLFARGAGRWWRKGYRGSSQYDLWQLHSDGHYEQLTTHNGQDQWPMVDSAGKVAYFVSDRDGIDNLWAFELSSGETRQLTHHRTDGVQWPSIQPGGERIIYEWDGGLYTIEVKGGQPRKLQLTVASESKDNWKTREDFWDDADEYAVSPHGKYVAVVVDGDLWAVKDPEAYDDDEKPDQDLERAWRLTASDGARERNPAFAPDNRHLAYASDADGDYEIYLLDLGDMAVTQLTDNDVDDLGPQFSPADADVLFYYHGNSALICHDLAADEASTVVEGNFRGAFGHYGYEVSPDGQWVAYVEEIGDWSTEVFVVECEGESEPVNITRYPDYDNAPHWSADGRRLVFRSGRMDEDAVYVIDLDPEPEQYDLEFLFDEDTSDEVSNSNGDEAADDDKADDDDNGDNEDDENNDDEDDEDEDDEDDEDDDEGDGDEQIQVTIDFEDIHLRARRVSTQLNAGAAAISRDGEWVVYRCRPDQEHWQIWAVKAEGGDARKLLDSSWDSPQFVAKGKRIYYRDGGEVRYLKFKDGSNKGRETIHAHGDFTLDRRERWAQMFREGWRTLGERFYDASMHGADWNAVYEKYAPMVKHIATPEEFGLLFYELMGEINASHLGIYMAEDSGDVDGPATCHLGLEFDPAYAGPGLRVEHITYQGPADQPGVEIAPGDIVLAIRETEVSNAMYWQPLLDDLQGQPVRLTVAGGSLENEREVVLKPITYSSYQNLLYREWEIMNEQAVAEASDDRIGYIHIRGMSRSELRKFEREFFSEVFDKDALIVDVRFNPGGWIHEELFSLLDLEPFAYAGTRDTPLVLQPRGIFDKPKALLINARSASDAEIFPAGWRQLELGPVIGVETYGAVIGTTSFTLIDGTRVRLPVTGWYELDMRNMERSGTPPDVHVDVHPAELREGYDAQLAKAVELLLAELEANED